MVYLSWKKTSCKLPWTSACYWPVKSPFSRSGRISGRAEFDFGGLVVF
jgi:hypothetical protein